LEDPDVAIQRIFGSVFRSILAIVGAFAAPRAVAHASTVAGRGLREIVVQTAAARTLTVEENGKKFSTKGAAGTVTFTLPAATVGLRYGFYVGAVQELRVDPAGTEVMQLPGTGVNQAGGAYLTANAIGETLEIECNEAGVWAVVSSVGTWTAV
jgi:hypothetical protein